MLKLQFKDRRRESVWLVDSRFTIGKANNNSLMLDDASVENTHAEIINEQDQLSIKKQTVKGSVKVNGIEISDTSPLKANDSIHIGSVGLELIDSQSLASPQYRQQPWSLHSSASWLEKQDYIINQKTVIGRDPGCDICLSLDYLSRKHISLEPLNGKLFIEDLNSSNGTFVNGEKIQKTELKPGDKIKLDVLTFEVRGPSAKSVNDPHKTIIRSVPKASPIQAKPIPAKAGVRQEAAQKQKAAAATGAKQNIKQPAGSQAGKVQPVPVPAAERLSVKDKSSARKRLAAEGKQAWLSGDNQLKPKAEKRKGNKGLLIGLAVVIILAGGAFYILNSI